MANISDEATFDEFAKTLTWEGRAEKIHMPFLCIAGGADELSPIENTEHLFRALPGRDSSSSTRSRGTLSAVVFRPRFLGPMFNALAANWLAARFAGRTFPSERWFVDNEGNVTKSAI